MNKFSNEEIEDKFKEIFQSDYYYDYNGKLSPQTKPPVLTIHKNTEEEVVLEFSKMYEAPEFNAQKLFAICKFFDTDNVNNTDDFSYSGCETCDYGSSYGFYLYIKKGNPWRM